MRVRVCVFRKHLPVLPTPELASDGRGIVNQLHYEDAAGVAVAALLASENTKKVWLASDDEPLARSAIVEAALKSPLYSDRAAPVFIGEDGPKGKVYDTSRTRDELKWRPKYPSFASYMKSET